jgi:flagellar brake protein
MESQSDFLISSPDKIFSKLSVLLKNKNLLTARNPENSASFVTTVLEVDKNAKTFICDGCDDELTEQMLNSRKVFFKTEYMGALVTFDTPPVTKTKYQGNPAFSVPIPSTLRWLEQREFYRVRIPSNSASYCQITLENGETVQLKLYDISIRGFSILNNAEELSERLFSGLHFDDAKLFFDEKQAVSVSFDILSVIVINPNNLNKMDKIGCKLSQITPTLENTIHSYMLSIERELLKRRTEKTPLF